MKRCIGLVMLVVLTASACGGDNSSDPVAAPPADNSEAVPPPAAGWTRVQSRNDLSGLRVAPIEEIVWNDDETVALVRYLGPAEPCSGSTVTVTETDTNVSFKLESGLTPEAAVTTCVAAIFNYEIAVTLDAPLAGRDVVRIVALADDPDVADPFEGAEFPTDQYLGLSEAEANDLAAIEQRELRIVAVDGEFFVVTDDFVSTRVNIELIDDEVVNAYSG